MSAEIILLVLVSFQFVFIVVKEFVFLRHIKELEFKLMTNSPEMPVKDTVNEIEQRPEIDIKDLDPLKGVEAIKKLIKK